MSQHTPGPWSGQLEQEYQRYVRLARVIPCGVLPRSEWQASRETVIRLLDRLEQLDSAREPLPPVRCPDCGYPRWAPDGRMVNHKAERLTNGALQSICLLARL